MLKGKVKPHFGKLSIVLIAVIVALVAADLLTKYFEEKFYWNATIIPNFIEIQSGHRNFGCAFSFLNDNPQVGQPILITFTFLLLAFLVFLFICLPQRFYLLRVAITIVIAGALGNLYDRLFVINEAAGVGNVRDWFGINMFGHMTFCNLADFWITIGVALAIIDLLFFNEYSVLPLTKKAKAAQKARKEKEDAEEREKKALKSESVTAPAATEEAAQKVTKEVTEENSASSQPAEIPKTETDVSGESDE